MGTIKIKIQQRYSEAFSHDISLSFQLEPCFSTTDCPFLPGKPLDRDPCPVHSPSTPLLKGKPRGGICWICTFSTRNPRIMGNTKWFAVISFFKMFSSLMFSLHIKSVCSGAGSRGSELHPRTEALLRQDKPLVVPSPQRGVGGDAGLSELLGVGEGACLTRTDFPPLS